MRSRAACRRFLEHREHPLAVGDAVTAGGRREPPNPLRGAPARRQACLRSGSTNVRKMLRWQGTTFATMRVTVLGAGSMGSAMACVAERRGHQVRLWGTWLDDAALAPCERGAPHPRLETLDGIASSASGRLHEALDRRRARRPRGQLRRGRARDDQGRRLAPPTFPCSASPRVFRVAGPARWSASTGWSPSTSGGRSASSTRRPGEGVRGRAGRAHVDALRRGRSTGWASRTRRSPALRGDGLVVTSDDDLAGAEMCSALKNAYATGLGLWDGASARTPTTPRAACFTQAIRRDGAPRRRGRRPRRDRPRSGGRRRPPRDRGGRANRAFGERVGKGKPASRSPPRCSRRASYGGLPGHRHGVALRRERGVAELPLLEALHAVGGRPAEVKPAPRASAKPGHAAIARAELSTGSLKTPPSAVSAMRCRTTWSDLSCSITVSMTCCRECAVAGEHAGVRVAVPASPGRPATRSSRPPTSSRAPSGRPRRRGCGAHARVLLVRLGRGPRTSASASSSLPAATCASPSR